MTDKEIIKALECCMNGRCDDECPFRETREHCHNLDSLILDLINRQQAEVERLRKQNEGLHKRYLNKHTAYCELLDELEETKSEAIKEFAERLTHTLVINNEENTDYFDFAYTLETIDAVKKEMTGETKTEKCDCFCEEQRIKGWLDGNTPITEPITVCNGTRERDECTCGGDKSKCDFYAKDYSYGY